MSQHDRILTKRVEIVDELTCVRDEVTTAYTESLRSTARYARALSRLDQIIIAIALRPALSEPATAERPAPAPLAATPAKHPPKGQDEAGPEHDRKAPDEVSGRGAGVGITDQSGEFVAASGAGEAVAAVRDPAPAPDEPRVPRRASQVVPGNGQVQDGGQLPRADQILNLWGDSVLTRDEVAARLNTTADTVSVYLSKARRVSDHRVVAGDNARAELRYGKVMDEYAVTDLAPGQIDHKLGFAGGTSQKAITQAWGRNDERVKKGEALRRPPPKRAEPAKAAPPKTVTPQPAPINAEEIARDPMPIPDGFVIAIDRKHGEVVGPTGSWACAPPVGKALEVIADGQLYGHEKMATAAGIDKKALLQSIPYWRSSLRKIGVDLVETPHIGCKLNRIAA